MDPVRFLAASQIIGRVLKDTEMNEMLSVFWNGSSIVAEITDEHGCVFTSASAADELAPLSIALDRLAERLVKQ